LITCVAAVTSHEPSARPRRTPDGLTEEQLELVAEYSQGSLERALGLVLLAEKQDWREELGECIEEVNE